MTALQFAGFLGLAAITACWALAVVLYRVGTPGSVARQLSILLLVEGGILLTATYPQYAFGLTDENMVQHPDIYQVQFILHTLFDAAIIALYPPFLAAALNTKMTRPFGGKKMRIALAIAAVVLALAVLLSSVEVGATILYLTMIIVFGFALVASISAWLQATGGSRVRARYFALAFGLRDLCWGVVYALTIYDIWLGYYLTPVETDIDTPLTYLYALGTLFFVPMVAYGILRAHLFDIDLKIRWTIKQSTLATIVITFIFLVSEGADRFLSEELGNWGGLAAAAVVVFFLAPLQRFAENVANAAMPNTKDTPEYAAYRKMQVYEAALTEAHQDGGISDKERSLLDRLRDSLEISVADAEALERDLLAT